MAAAGPMPRSLAPEQAALDQDSTVSSPLSDVDEADEEDASLEGMNVDSNPGREEGDQASDSDSNLSEANDTEAETERLYDTPRTERHRDAIVRQYSDTQILQNTPSKLQKTYSVEDVAAGGDAHLSDQDNVSISSSRRGDTTPTTKHGKLVDTTPERDTQDSLESKKRKRSLGAEQSDSDQPLRKRTSSMAASDRAKHITPREDGDEVDDELSTHPSGNVTGAESGIEDAQQEPTPVGKPKASRETASPSKKSTTTKKTTRNGSKRKADNRGDRETGVHEEGAAIEEADQQTEAQADAEVDEEAEAAARDAEERKIRGSTDPRLWYCC